MSEGQTIYNGDTKSIKEYFKTNFAVEMRKFTNPADFLISMAFNPSAYKSNLTL